VREFLIHSNQNRSVTDGIDTVYLALLMYSAGILVHNKKMLLLHRDNIPTIGNPDKWGLIGGIIEDNETHEEAFRRESMEEISIVPQNLVYMGERVNAKGNRGFYYFAVLSKDEVGRLELGDEGQELRFFSFNELFDIELTKQFSIYIRDNKDKVRSAIEDERPIL